MRLMNDGMSSDISPFVNQKIRALQFLLTIPLPGRGITPTVVLAES